MKEENSFARELLKDLKAQNKRLFIIWIITFIALIGMVGYTVYLLNDIGTEETITTTETYDMNTENGNNNYIGGDNYGEIENN